MKKYIYCLFLLLPIVLLAEYKNSDGKAINKSFKELLEWSRNSEDPVLSYIDISSEWQNIDLANADNYVIWIGHSTFLIKKNGFTILTDPIFSERASPFKRVGPKRLIPPALSLEDIPKVDIVTVSHNHYDHLDIDSLQRISKLHPDGVAVVQIGVAWRRGRPRRAPHLLRGISLFSLDDVFGVEGVHGEARRGVGLWFVVRLVARRKPN